MAVGDVTLVKTLSKKIGDKNFTFYIYRPVNAKKVPPTSDELDAFKACYGMAIMHCVKILNQGCPGIVSDKANAAPSDKDILNMMTRRKEWMDKEYSTNVKETHGVFQSEIWGRFKKWEPPDKDWFEKMFKKKWEIFRKNEQHWIRNRFLAVILAMCYGHHNICLSTQESAEGYAYPAGDMKYEFYKDYDGVSTQKGGIFRGHGLGGNVNKGTTVDHTYAFQKSCLLEMRRTINKQQYINEDPNDQRNKKAMLYLKRDDLAKIESYKDFVQTILHECSHLYAWTEDYYYIRMSKTGDIYGLPDVGFDRLKVNLGPKTITPQEIMLLKKGLKKLSPELLSANADSIASYICGNVPSTSGMMKRAEKLYYKFRKQGKRVK